MSELQVKLPHSSIGGHLRNLGLFEWKTVLFSLVTAIFITPPEAKILSSLSQGSFKSEALNLASQKEVSRDHIFSQASLGSKKS